MQRLIITNSGTGADHLKQARIADKVLCVSSRLMQNPWCGLPPDILSSARQSHRVELWIDPGANAQLLLLKLLDLLSRHVELADRVLLVHAEIPIGWRSPGDRATQAPRLRLAGAAEIKLARHAWRAFTQPTPHAWWLLLQQDLRRLPYLRNAVLSLLDELPSIDNALSRTQQILLEAIAGGDATPGALLLRYLRSSFEPPSDYWEAGAALDQLAKAPTPAVLGLGHSRSMLAMHTDSALLQQYRRSKLSLSTLGRDLLAGRDDFARRNPIDRRWGGTHLGNDRLWRWGATGNRLLPPAPEWWWPPVPLQRHVIGGIK